MRNTECMGNCVFASVRQLIGEHLSIVVSAGVVGALFGLVAGGGAWGLAGAAIGIGLALAYGGIPRMADCVGACPIR